MREIRRQQALGMGFAGKDRRCGLPWPVARGGDAPSRPGAGGTGRVSCNRRSRLQGTKAMMENRVG